MNNRHKRTASAFLSLAMILSLVSLASGQRLVTVPVGTVIGLRMDTHISSDTSRVGDRFTATVFREVTVDGRAAVPAGAKVEGHIAAVTPAERASKAGTLAIAFDRIVFSRGYSIPVDATLTTLNEEGRRRIEQDIDNEGRVGGGNRTRRGILFIGGGAGAGAVIGAVTSGAKGAAVGAGIGAVLGTIGLLLSNGEKAEVQAGTEFGMMVERSFTVDTDRFDRAGDQGSSHNDGDTGITSQDVLNSADSIRAAQIALRDRGFYNGPINGAMNQATRAAIRQFQHDRNLADTGYLDSATARALGIPSDSDNEPTQNVFTSSESVRFAQTTLRDRGYYNGQINGVMTNLTRTAIRQFQQGNNLPVTGDLDMRTARMLGIASETGYEARQIEIANPRAERIDRDSIRISLDIHTQGSGWQVFVNRFVTGNTLHVYVRGTPPRYGQGTTTDHRPFTETYDNLPNVVRVIIHGPQRDYTADLQGGGSTGGTGIGNPRQIATLALRLLQNYQRDLNVRNNRGQVIFDRRRNIGQNEVQILSQINSLQAAAQLYYQLTISITDPDAVKGGADALVRQARLLDRLIRRYTQLTLSATVRNDWQQLQSEIARINVIDTNPDSDIIR